MWERCIVTFFPLTQWLYCFLIWVTDTYRFIWLIHAISWLTWRTLETKGFIVMVLWSHPHFSLPFITPYFPPSLCVQREVHQREVLAFSLIISTTTLVSIFLDNENIYKVWGLHVLWMIFNTSIKCGQPEDPHLSLPPPHMEPPASQARGAELIVLSLRLWVKCWHLLPKAFIFLKLGTTQDKLHCSSV